MADGQYQSPPPPYQCIVNAAGETNTLPCYLDITVQRVVGSKLPCQTTGTADERKPDTSHGHACNEGPGQAAQTLDLNRDPLGAVLSEQDFISFFQGGS